MAKIHGLLDVGRMSMQNAQTALQTTAHNISNKSTEGYSRQRVDLQANPAIWDGPNRLGTGARVGSISRTNDPWLEKQIQQESTSLAFMEGQSGALSRLENVMNESTVKGLNSSITDFFNSFRELANNPESAVTRTAVRDAGIGMVSQFEGMNKQIDSVSMDLNKQIETGIGEVNGYAKEIAQLNEKIMNIEITGASGNDERDRRDLLVKKLAEKVDLSYAEDEKTGMLNITAGRTGVLVAGTSWNNLKTWTDQHDNTRVVFELSPNGGKNVDITDQFKKGALGGVIDMRDNTIKGLKSGLSDLAKGIATEVNRAHVEGYDRYSQAGVNFFQSTDVDNYSIDNFKLNRAIMDDVGRIAAAAKPGAVGDNTTANVIHSLQFSPLMGDGKYTFDDFYNSKVGEIGVMAQRANSGLDGQKGIVDQLKNIRESVSGVSLDEEAARMIEFQKTFEASARVIRMADEMFDTVLNLRRF